MIDSVSLSGFKCFNSKVKIPLSQITIMYGKNGRGKSSVSQSLLLIGQSMKRNNDLSQLFVNGDFVSQGSFKELLSEESSNSFEIEIISSEGEVISAVFSSVEAIPQIGLLSGLCVNGINKFEEKTLRQPDGAFSNSFNHSFSNRANDSSPTIGVTSDVLTLQQLKEIIYVSADRKGPVNSVKTEYNKDDIYINPQGSNVINIIADRGERFLNEVKAAMSHILSGASILYHVIGDNIELELNSINDGKTYRPINVGYGYSYILPLIVAALVAKQGSIVIIENPEAHLHPGAQSRLAEFLIQRAKTVGFQLIIESHSDHVINGLRISTKKSIIEPADSIIDYFAHDDYSSAPSVTPITCDKNGTLSEYPDDFMDEWTSQMIALI